MAGKRRWFSLKSKKCRFCVRDPCTTYPEEYKTQCWNEHEVENANTEIRKSNKSPQAGES